ncbi:hypothetical protein NQ317_002342 [Molorchus minor]|uniref:Uncharacterized protein n=1 Tax=Molorchus minor TaxID=1323400 RepID=A0ABQ9IR43_9CUCU|nr:hypothetical protein NQ317_002342 [Molorchus minor]
MTAVIHEGDVCDTSRRKRITFYIALNVSGKMIVDFHKCVSELEHWKGGKAVLLCGLGNNFCSGGDLDFARSTGTPKEGFYVSYLMQDVLRIFRKLPFVTFSLIHGSR